MRAVLKYEDLGRNHRIVHGFLALNNIEVLKFKQQGMFDYYSRVTIRIKNYQALTNLVYKLNKDCGVIIAKTMPDNIWDWFKK